MSPEAPSARTNEGTADTREALLDAAEELFASQGIAETSLRAITSDAKQNLASVHYHFGSKDGLVREVFSRRLGELNRGRIEVLDAAEKNAGPDGPPLRAIVHAFVAPSMNMMAKQPSFMQICGRFQSHPNEELHMYFLQQFDDVVIRFRDALTKALPHVPIEDLFWRMHFLVGAMIHTWTNHRDMEIVTNGMCKFDKDELVDRLVTFATAALQAPADSGEQA